MQKTAYAALWLTVPTFASEATPAEELTASALPEPLQRGKKTRPLPPRRGASKRLQLRLPVLPFCAETLVRTIEQNGALWHLFDARDVPRFFTHEKYTCFFWHTDHGAEEHLLADSLDALERRLAPHHFLRVERGELINLRFLRSVWFRPRRMAKAKKIRDVRLELADGQMARVSRRRLPQLREQLQALRPGLQLPREVGIRPLPL